MVSFITIAEERIQKTNIYSSEKLTTNMAGDYILYYYNLCIAIIIVFLIFMVNPFNISDVSMQNASASFICVGYSNNAIIAKVENCELLDSPFHRVDLFSELSRNMTPSSSSSDLFEATEDTTIQEDVESSNTEADNLQNEATSGETNQSLSSQSPSSPSDLFLGNEETGEGQDGVENGADANIQGQDVITSEESPESNTNST